MAEASIFPPDSRLELINGEILEMSPIGPNHASHLKRLFHFFAQAIDFNQAILSIQDPLQLGKLSEPEPDLMLLRPDPDFYSAQHPVAEDVFLITEVADHSLSFDQNQKLRLYALHNIPEYWLLNLNESCLEVYRQPHDESYEAKSILHSGDSLKLLKLPDLTVNIKDIL